MKNMTINLKPCSRTRIDCYLLETIAGHNRRWINGLIPMVLIDTFGLIFINPSLKIFIFDRQYRQSIKKAFSDRWSSDHRLTLNRQYRSKLQLKKISRFLPWGRKNAQLLLKKTVVKSVKIAKTLKGQLNFNLKIKDRYSKKKFRQICHGDEKTLNFY